LTETVPNREKSASMGKRALLASAC